MIRIFTQILFLLILSGCALFGANQVRQLDDLYGEEKTHNREASSLNEKAFYLSEVKPVLDNRCVVCHACYDAACQLKLSSPAGIDRGGSKELVYNASVFTREPSRLFIDADHTAEWRKSDFHPVLNEREQSAEANLEASVLYKMLALKNNNPLPSEHNQILPTSNFNFDLNHERQCPYYRKISSLRT